eukprot:5427095-Amphidinium_carterae.1
MVERIAPRPRAPGALMSPRVLRQRALLKNAVTNWVQPQMQRAVPCLLSAELPAPPVPSEPTPHRNVLQHVGVNRKNWAIWLSMR